MTDGAAMYHASLYEGTLGAPAHGCAARHDWSVTLESLRAAQDHHVRYERLAASLTREQREAVWSAPGPEAALLRRFVR